MQEPTGMSAAWPPGGMFADTFAASMPGGSPGAGYKRMLYSIPLARGSCWRVPCHYCGIEYNIACGWHLECILHDTNRTERRLTLRGCIQRVAGVAPSERLVEMAGAAGGPSRTGLQGAAEDISAKGSANLQPTS